MKVVHTMPACLQKVIPRDFQKEHVGTLKVGENSTQKTLTLSLEFGKRLNPVEHSGETIFAHPDLGLSQFLARMGYLFYMMKLLGNLFRNIAQL